jgi:hypothetical protein
VYIAMDIEGDDETSVTVHQLYKQVGETLDLPVHVPSIDSGERAGRMFRGFEFWPPEKQLMLLRQEFRRPYGANEIRKWMYSNGITPQEVTSLIRVQGVYVGDDKDRCPLIDFDHWPDVNEKLRQQVAVLPCDVETGHRQPNATDRSYRPQIDDSEDELELTRQYRGLLGTCAEIVITGFGVFGNYLFSGRPVRT